MEQSLEDWVTEIAELEGWACVVLVGILCEIIENCQFVNATKRMILEKAAQGYELSGDYE